MRSALLGAGVLGCVALLTGCGELPQTTFYKQGHYQGKPDALPWDSDAFKGDKTAWDKAIAARNEKQNEYARIGK
jgi:hypothetical protein